MHRLLFEKKGNAVYISHLDLMRTFQRAFLRAGLRVKHTEGFNPHVYLSIALPLSIGAESDCELLDFELLSGASLDAVPERINACLPAGIRVLQCYEAARKLKEIAWLDIAGTFAYNGSVTEALLDALRLFFAQESIVISKRSKKGMREFDVAPCIEGIAFRREADNEIGVSLLASAQDPALNPELLVDALRQLKPELVPDFAKFRRLRVLDGQLQAFR